VVIRKRVLVKSFANSSSQSLTTFVAVFKTFEFAVDILCQTIGHGFAARDYFAVGHDLPQVVFDRFVHVAIILDGATVISVSADLNLLMTTSDVASGFRSALATTRGISAMLLGSHSSNAANASSSMFGLIASAVRRLSKLEVGSHFLPFGLAERLTE
jgi:hypothetical protein